MKNDTITAIGGIRVGHAEREGVPSGCTVLLPERGAVAGVDIRGGGPGTYGTDSLNPINLIDTVHGLFFAGGSAFGLSAAEGVRKYLHEREIGFESGFGVIPIVAGAIIFDLGINRTGVFPDSDLAYAACRNATDEPVREGNAGCGVGATVGKLFGPARCMKSGLGSSCIHAAGGIDVGALVVVNAFGEIYDPATGQKVAGARRDPSSLHLAKTLPELLGMTAFPGFSAGSATVVGVVATNARLDKTQLSAVARMAHDGLARTIHPVHTQYDGDTVFALSCGKAGGAEVSMVGALASMALSEAVLRAVRKARRLESIPACEDILP